MTSGCFAPNPHRFDAIIVASPCRLKMPAYCSWNCAPLPLHVSTSRTANERGAREPRKRVSAVNAASSPTQISTLAIFAVTVVTAARHLMLRQTPRAHAGGRSSSAEAVRPNELPQGRVGERANQRAPIRTLRGHPAAICVRLPTPKCSWPTLNLQPGNPYESAGM